MKAKGLLAVVPLLLLAVTAGAVELSPLETLGKKLFFDPSLSNPPGQSCAECHDPAVGWTGPDAALNAGGAVYEGVVHTRFGNRKPPTSAYAGFTPILHQCGGIGDMGMCGSMGGGVGGGMGGGMGGMEPGSFVGGIFWDGRATGWTLGDPVAEQAMGPFLNPLEQNNPNAKHVCLNVMRTEYAPLFEEVWGAGSLDCVKDVNGTYERIARSIAAYERSAEVSPFSSRFDIFWKNTETLRPPVRMINSMNKSRFANRGLSDLELQGLVIFNTKGNCSSCHFLQPMHGSRFPLFTDFRYHNLGVPKNPANPFDGMPPKWNPDGVEWIDKGLGGFLAKTAGMTDSSGAARDFTAFAAENMGKQRTPTLRNVDKRISSDFIKAYAHNGYFKSLDDIIDFYNLRDVLPQCNVANPPLLPSGEPSCFPPPEVAENIDTNDLGDLKLTSAEVAALVAFLQTLSDGYEEK
ncbi:cytochrome-c peroxidase [Geomonas sp. RF6]|uniref:cytochrome-c peroxidase n=1 Tax=Geomonas sp. RF6 TaxID=2897342 RepID=UPI001E31CE4C|nr:cytochrome c peroxidase [Geomonas sp. RF6]UFS69334.1 cytochrome-c peroxidase [Geomonas sp. RF6]